MKALDLKPNLSTWYYVLQIAYGKPGEDHKQNLEQLHLLILNN